MIFTNPLDKIFSQQSKIKLLRFLVQHRGEFTGREIAKSVGPAHPTVHSALSHLREQGIIFMRKSGNPLLYSLNRRHQATKDIIIPVFKKESQRLSLISKKGNQKWNIGTPSTHYLHRTISNLFLVTYLMATLSLSSGYFSFNLFINSSRSGS